MIYNEDFIKFLQDNLGADGVSIKNSKNIITRCPWCEYNKVKKHYHLYISKNDPMFHCFHAGCGVSGVISKLIKKIQGNDSFERYIIPEKLEEAKKHRVEIKVTKPKTKIYQIPPVNESLFSHKIRYVTTRLKFADVDIKNLRGIILDVKQFLTQNKIMLEDKVAKLVDYLQANFVGFITDNHSFIMFRNIDPKATFKHYKLHLQQTDFLDYYTLRANNPESNQIVIAEGIYNIYTEHIFDNLNLRSSASLYASAMSSSFLSLIKSIIFYEQIFKPEVHILSDRDVTLKYYRDLKKYNSHIIDKLVVYYNRTGKDFNSTPVIPEKFVL